MLRRNAESILFSRAETTELKNLDKSLKTLTRNQRYVVYAESVLRFLQEFFVYVGSVVVYGVVGVAIIKDPHYATLPIPVLSGLVANVPNVS